MSPKVLPTIMIALSFISSIGYAINDISDWRHWGYWLSGSLITICVTY